MSDKNSQNEQEPEETRRERIEKKLERYRFFSNSALGQRWSAYKEKLKLTKRGKALLVGINILGLAALIGAYNLIRYESSDFFNPPDYNLTEEQVNEGYSRTRWDGGPRSSRGQQDIYYRFYKEEEYTLPSCDREFDWCVFAIPLHVDCEQVTMKFETTKTADSSEIVEEMEVSVQSKNGLPFFLGQRVTLGVTATKDDSMYGGVKSIWCTNPYVN
jgi:hypothetical protein